MTEPSDFEDDELGWLSMVQRTVGVMPPTRVADKLVARGVAEKANLGLKLTDSGLGVLARAREVGRLAGQRP